MKTTASKKKSSLFLLAAVVLVSALLTAPTAEASRYLPEALTALKTLPPLNLADIDQADAEDFWLFAESDVEHFGILALLDASEREQLNAETRIRLFADSGAIPRPSELAVIRKLASGFLTCGTGLNIWETGDLAQDCGSPSFQGLWTDPTTGIAYARNRWYDARNASWLSEDPKGAVDSVNLYAFVGWGPHMGRDPMGLSVVQMLAEEEQAWLETLPEAEREEYLAATRKGDRQALSMVAGAVPGVGELHDASQVITGQDYLAGEKLSGSGRWLAGVGIFAPYAGGKVLRVIADTPPARWVARKTGDAAKATRARYLAWKAARRQRKLAKQLVDDAPRRVTNTSGETASTAFGKSTHKEQADVRRLMGEFDLVNTPIRDQAGNPILVSKRVNLRTGEPVGSLERAIPDAVSFRRGLIIDDKPLGRPIAKDRQEIIKYIRAYEQSKGVLPDVVAVQRYNPQTGVPVHTELYSPADFLPSGG